MSFFVYVWIAISVFLLAFWAWSNYVLYSQKKAWKIFAQKRGLRYNGNGLFDAPTMSGAIDGYRISFFTSEHSELDARSQRRLTAIELNMHSSLPVAAALASGGMVNVVETLAINQEYKPEIKGWDNEYIIRTASNQVTEGYFTEERLTKIIELMEMDKVWVICLFLQESGLLRIDTPLPIDDPKAVDTYIKKMIEVAKVLELKKGEDKKMLEKRSKLDTTSPVLDVDDNLLDDDIGFELEDDDGDNSVSG